jgi:hypothetical protein
MPRVAEVRCIPHRSPDTGIPKSYWMAPKLNRGVEMQRKYYTDMAAQYEQMHEHEGSGDPLANKFVYSIRCLIAGVFLYVR